MALPVSIVVVSRHRPAALMRCLTGISQLDYPGFEVIVVACPAGLAALGQRADADLIKQVPYDEPNISAARNLGISRAAGEIVAFIDDDAVPEPLWLTHLAAPFDIAEVAAAGGFVIGRNGITFQWTARTVDATGQATPLDVSDTQPTVLHPTPDRAIKTEGTNMALRRDVLENVEAAAKAHGLRFSVEEKSWLSPAGLDTGIRTVLTEEADRLGYTSLTMPSGAGHDAQTMQSFCPSGLIFIPSRNGISHAPEEWSDWADIEKGAQLMLNALVRLAA